MKNRIAALIAAFIIAFSALSCRKPVPGTNTTDTVSEITSTSEIENTSVEEPSKDISKTEEGECTSHVDGDGNGFCDLCDADVIFTVNLYALNDLHGKFCDSDSQPGVDELTSYLKNARESRENVFVFSVGDMWQGTAESGLTFGSIVNDWMNYLDFEFMTLGNHEFDWGDEPIIKNASESDFDFLAINVYSESTNSIADFCKPSVFADLGEIQVGFIGAIGDCYSSISAEMSTGYYFKTGSQLTNLVKAESNRLRAMGADIIVYSIHDGGEGSTAVSDISSGELSSYYDISLSDGYVDVVFEGHSHQAYINRDSKGVYHIQGGGENTAISHAVLTYNTANKTKTVKPEIITNGVYSKYEDDSIVSDLMEKYDSVLGGLNEVIGKNDMSRNSSALRQTVAELYCRIGEEKWGNKYDIVLGGGFLSCRSPSRLASGNVDYAMLYQLFPFNNRLALCSCSGRDLKKNYINTSNNNYFVSYSTYGNGVKNEIDDNAVYYIITDSYNYTYKYNRLTVVEYYEDGIYARDLMADHIKNGNFSSGILIDLPEKDTLLTAKEVEECGKKLPENGETPEKYYFTGVITAIENTKYGNLYIKDGEGNSVYVYGLYSSDGIRFDGMQNQPKIGDTVTVYGVIKRFVYNGKETVEFFNARLKDLKK